MYISYTPTKFETFMNSLLIILIGFIIYKIIRYWKRRKLPPGPKGIPIFGALPFLGTEPHKNLNELRTQYGDIIGLYLGSTYTVVLNEYKVAKEVLSNPVVCNRAPNIFHHVPQFGFITENGEKWQEQRRFCMSAIRDLGIGKGYWEDVIKEEVESYVELLMEAKGKPIEIDHSLAISIASNIIAFFIGRKLDKVKEKDKIELMVEFPHVVLGDSGPASIMSTIPGIWNIFKLFTLSKYNRIFKIINNFRSFIQKEIIHHRQTKSDDIQDFLSLYLEEIRRRKKVGNISHSFSEATLEGNVNSLFIGSSDTIFTSIIWLLRLMTDYKDVQEKVYAELMEGFGKDGEVRYEERDKIPFTMAVIMEALRYSSIVPMIPNRKAFQDVHINGFKIPKGTEITANFWAIHKDPAYWDEPEKFKPERFLIDDGTKLVKNPPGYIPFSIGRRNCPGETIAWIEILTYFTEIIKKFEVSTPIGEKTEYNIVKGLVTGLAPQHLCFKERRNN